MNNIRIYHNCGFRDNWNKDVFEIDKVGYGFILSPRDMTKNYISSMDDSLIKKSFFDSQFYNLGFINQNYLSYNFLDCIDTLSDYANEKDEIAKKNIEYQNNIDFEYINIPTFDFDLLNNNLYDGLYNDMIESQVNFDPKNKLSLLNELIIKPFTKYIKEEKINKKVLITIIFDLDMAQNVDRYNDLLTLITNNEVIDGVCIIPKCQRSYKRVSNIQFLFRMMCFINDLKRVNMEVIVTNCDVESILYAAAGADAVSLGIYENLRHYDGSRFAIDDSFKHGPNPRMFSYKLLQWIDYTYLYPLSDKFDMADLFEINKYYDATKIKGYKWHFLKAEPYKHYMLSFNNIINDLPESINDRVEYVKKMLNNAIVMNKNIRDCGIIFDESNGDSHISQWLTALSKYESDVLRGE